MKNSADFFEEQFWKDKDYVERIQKQKDFEKWHKKRFPSFHKLEKKEKDFLRLMRKNRHKLEKLVDGNKEVKALNLKQELEIDSLKRTQDILIERNVNLSLKLEKKERDLEKALLASKESFYNTNN